jgi:haloalkane dehalogenase
VGTRPAWVNDDLFPFESRFVDVDGAEVHYIDEGDGPVLLCLHGNPTWSFLYRHVVDGLKDRFRCIALDYPGFGLSTAPAGYGFTAGEHARIVEGFVEQLGLRDVTLMVQDWGGPIGFWVAGRNPERFKAFVIGNTWGWPNEDLVAKILSKVLGSATVGGYLVERVDVFTNVLLPSGMRRKELSADERFMYKRPHPTPESRVPLHVLPREIVAAGEFLAEVEQGLWLPTGLRCWCGATRTRPSKLRSGCAGNRPSHSTGPRSFAARRISSRRMHRTRSSLRSATGGRGICRTDIRARPGYLHPMSGGSWRTAGELSPGARCMCS